ncbi:RNA-dependent RNA polymerase 1 [Lasiodiplodia hormozganensis]|uniref:RNA-directed RNA polymerase n=1 Tax=Lasiodiplodia hormozganensis TaxID=869390 RepID=A0AA40D356_9PEZI|nr:RNA-dependent RNA polymerase 1 [Lasiodiplodia hormozganensis]
MENNEWKSWQNLKVKVHDLPLDIATVDLYRLFKHEGTISRIDIVREMYGKVAFVVFSPPPRRAFWKDMWFLPAGQSGPGIQLRVEARGPDRQLRRASPANPLKTYPEIMTISASSIDFGFMYNESAMMIMQNASPIPPHNISVTLNLKWAKLIVQFPLSMFNEEENFFVTQPFRFEISTQRLSKIHEAREGDKRILIIPSDCVPRYARKAQEVERTHNNGDSSWDESKAWYRSVDIAHLREPLKTAPTALRKKNATIDIGRWTTYKIEFDASSTNLKQYDEMLSALTDWNVSIVGDTPIELLEKEQPILWDIIDTPQSYSPRRNASPYGLQPEPIHLDFEVRYQLEACLSNNILNEHNITRDFIQRLAKMNGKMAKAYLDVAMDKKQRFYEPMDIFKLPLGKKGMQKEIPTHCVWSRAATVTPSTIIISSPSMEISNRVVRDYIEHSDRFLRVKFTDEKYEGKLGSRSGDSDNELFTRVWRTLSNGITIGDRHYEFLAFGNSQFREHGAYFFSSVETDEVHLTPSYIRGSMGGFEDIKEVARYASRMGQCFSTTRAVTSVKAGIGAMEDVKRNGYTFTDGVGKISPLLAQKVAEEFGHPNPVEDTPSVFQFRLGGCKGILAVSPELEGHKIVLRRSQEKFAADHDGLEIIKWSQYATATLNRQLIIVLDALEVPEHVFMTKLRGQLSGLTNAMTSEDVALRFLQKSVDPIQTTLTLAGMVMDGFMSAREPFLMSVLHVWRAWSLKNLKEKAKLFIGDGAFLLGCVDETASLRGHFYSEQGETHCTKKDLGLKILPEIFVQISDPDHEGRYKVIEGLCIVARNPSLHPGDIRVLSAVDKPQLHHLKNVVVFPQTGDRDIPNMCSGGDLDGDDYLVIWDKDLIPNIINHSPMDFTPDQGGNERLTVEEVTMEDISRFFVEYIKNDSLGQIAYAHLATADFEYEGVMSDKCLELARLHSRAVDYPKSGLSAKMTRNDRPKKYPHFMEKPPEKTYVSKKILGQLYDAVETVDPELCYGSPFDSRILNAYKIEPEVLAKAAEIKELYDTAVRKLMAQHDIKTEFEVWSTFILKHNTEIRDYSLQEEFGRIWEALRERYQKLCYEEAAGGYKEDIHGSDEKKARATLQEQGRAFKNLGPFIAAMYTVTAREMQRATELVRQTKIDAGRSAPAMKMTPANMPLMSFPWIFPRELGLIAAGAKERPEGFKAQHSAPLKSQAGKQKPKLGTSAQGGWTKEDELFVDGGAVIKKGELLDIFGESSRSGRTQQSGHAAPGKNALEELKGLQLSADENMAKKGGLKPKPPPQMVKSESEKGKDEADPEGLYTDDGPYPPGSYEHPYFSANVIQTNPSKDHSLSTTKSAESNKAPRIIDSTSIVDESTEDNDGRGAEITTKSTEKLVAHATPPSVPSSSRPPSIPPHLRSQLPLPPMANRSRATTPASLMGLPVTQEDENDTDGDDDELVIGVEEEAEVDQRKILGHGRRNPPSVGRDSSVQSVAELVLLNRMERELEESVAGDSRSYESDKETRKSVVDSGPEKELVDIDKPKVTVETGMGDTEDDKKMVRAEDDGDVEVEQKASTPKKKRKGALAMLKKFS